MASSKLTSQLRALGLDPEDVRDIVHERWELYEPEFELDQPHLLFIQGFVEGLMTGAVVRRKKGATITRDELFEALDYAVAIAQEWSS